MFKANLNSHAPQPGGARAISGLLLALCTLCSPAAWALDPPRDIWADPDWHVGLLGLKPGAARSVRWTEQLLTTAQPGAEPVVVSYSASRLVFDDKGRLSALNTERQRRGERDERRQLRYEWDAEARLQRIDEEGVTEPLWQRRVDAAGRVVAETERRGVSVQRTVFKYDAAGRETERSIERGAATPRIRERRSYHPNGALKSIDTEAKGQGSRTISFDPMGRPLKVTEREVQSLRVAQYRYPTPLSVVIDDSTATLARGGLRKTARELSFRVRRGEELQTPNEPQQPVSRRETRNGHSSERQTDFDDEGRAMVQRVLEDERVRCVIEWQYHASGLPLVSRARQPGGEMRCAGEPEYEAQIELDSQGNWVRQVIHFTHADGRRVRMAEHTREIEYR